MPVLERAEEMVPVTDSGVTEDDETSWRTASLILADHFCTVMKYAEKAFLRDGRRAWPFHRQFQHEILTADYGFDAAVERRLLSEFCSGWWDSYFMEVAGSAAMGKTPVGYDLFVFWAIEHMSEVALASSHREHLTMAHLFARALAQRSREAVDRRDKADVEFRDLIWRDAVSIRELRSLARREERVVEKYGEKNVEGRFEDSLNLLMQSLGFMVVPTQRGQRRVDLICISSGGGSDPYTMLVEAKSTHNHYALPTKDARAITEYIRDVRGRLKTLPPLKLVLIVGPEGSKTIKAKIEDLNYESSVPVRYLVVDALILLYEALRGVVPADSFLRAMTAADGIVSRADIDSIIGAYRNANTAHSEFISRLLGG
ncbi:hypothetical protein [Streptomyces sp. TE5632]